MIPSSQSSLIIITIFIVVTVDGVNKPIHFDNTILNLLLQTQKNRPVASARGTSWTNPNNHSHGLIGRGRFAQTILTCQLKSLPVTRAANYSVFLENTKSSIL